MVFGKIQEQWNFQKRKSFKNKTRTSLKSERSFFVKKINRIFVKEKKILYLQTNFKINTYNNVCNRRDSGASIQSRARPKVIREPFSRRQRSKSFF